MKIENFSTEVSVIVPVYNGAPIIGDCINALLNQTYPLEKYEIIVVDDGSTDRTSEILQRYSLSYFYQNNRGPAAARNKGVEMAQGNIVLFTDADCIPDSSWIAEMVAPFKSADIVGVKGAYKTKQKSLWAQFAQIEFNERYNILSKHTYIDMVDTYSAAFKKSVFISAGCFDISFPFPNGEDADLSYRMAHKGYKLVFNPKAFVWHTNHPDSMPKYVSLKFWRGYWRVKVYQKSPAKIIKDSYTPQTLKFQILFIYLALGGLLATPLHPSITLQLACWIFLMFMIVSCPFMLTSLRHCATLTFLAPAFLIVRALSIGLGFLYGLCKSIRKQSC
jgi:glycosyltransferase involved in cell wall biosynthesis